MDKESIMRKLDEGVGALRGLLAENEGSTLKTIASSAKQGFDSLKATFKENEQVQKAVVEIKAHLDELEKSIKAGDKKLSAKLLGAAEKKIKKYKKKYEGKTADAKAKPAGKAQPASKAITGTKPKTTARAAAKTTAKAGEKPAAKHKAAAKPAAPKAGTDAKAPKKAARKSPAKAKGKPATAKKS